MVLTRKISTSRGIFFPAPSPHVPQHPQRRNAATQRTMQVMKRCGVADFSGALVDLICVEIVKVPAVTL
jgi:hypothetical protein